MGFNLDEFADVARNITAGSNTTVRPNVAYGGAAEQPSTPAGNGFGSFLTGSLDKALNYALERDRIKTQNRYNMAPGGQQPPLPVQPKPPGGGFEMGTTTVVLLGAAAVGVLVLLLRK